MNFLELLNSVGIDVIGLGTWSKHFADLAGKFDFTNLFKYIIKGILDWFA